MAACAAVALNVCMLGVLTLGASSRDETLSRRMGAAPGVLEVVFIDLPSADSAVRAAVDPLIKLRAPRSALPLQLPNFSIPEEGAGDASRTEGAVATAIGPVSREYERQRLRAVYQEQLEAYLAQQVPLSSTQGVVKCVARLRLSTAGEVVEVNVTDCERGASEQRALAGNLQHVAALPLPPRADLFAPELVVTFENQIKVRLASEW